MHILNSSPSELGSGDSAKRCAGDLDLVVLVVDVELYALPAPFVRLGDLQLGVLRHEQLQTPKKKTILSPFP